MRIRIATFAVLAFAAAFSPAFAAVGFQHLTIEDPGKAADRGRDLVPDRRKTVRPNRSSSARSRSRRDAPVAGERLPLILISHGHGGSYAGHVDTAIALANAGYVVAALTHTGDNWRDTSLATALWERPRQLKRLDDYMLGAWPDHARIDPDRIGAFGFSAGGFTVLAAAGGEPDLSAMTEHCRAHPQFEDCRIVAAQPIHADGPITWVHDSRIAPLSRPRRRSASPSAARASRTCASRSSSGAPPTTRSCPLRTTSSRCARTCRGRPRCTWSSTPATMIS